MNRLSYKCAVTLCLLAIGGAVNNVKAQNELRRPIAPEEYGKLSNSSPPYYNPEKPVTCEIVTLYIDDAIGRVKPDSKTSLIFVVRLSEEEKERLAQIRLKQVKAYLSYRSGIKSVFAIGEKVQGYGQLEIYLKGELLYILPLEKNKGVNLHECIAI